MNRHLLSAFAAVIFTSMLVACGGGGGGESTSPPSASILSTTYAGNTETVKYSDGTSAVNTAKSSAVTWASDHVTKTTTYSFQDGTSNAETTKVAGVVGAPTYNGNVETVVTSFGDGTSSTATNTAVSSTVSWASDGVTQVTEYTFADGSKYNTSAKVPLLASTPILLPDLRPIYSTLCGPGKDDKVTLLKPILIDLNRDGRKDMILTLWCSQSVMGVVTTEPVVNRVVAFLQQADGAFINGTKDPFGTDNVSLTGGSINAVVYDFNGDGYDDIVFANSNEDGRLLPDSSNNIQSSYMMSLGNGKYTIGKFGAYQWGFSPHLMDNNVGKKDVLEESTAWRYATNTWNQLQSDYRWVSPNSVIFKRRADNEGSQISIANGACNGLCGDASGTLGLSLFTRTNTTDWSHVSELAVAAVTPAPYTSWNTSTGFAGLITLDGQDYFMPSIDQGCELKINANDESVAVMQFGAYKLPTAVWDGKPLVEGQNMTWTSKLIGFSVANSTLSRINLPIKNEITQFIGLHMTCGDVNGDGYDDIVVEPEGDYKTVPFIYINDKSGGFSLVNPSSIPRYASDYSVTSSMFLDIDGDGISDLMYWSLGGGGIQPNIADPIRFQIFKGLRNINASDLK